MANGIVERCANASGEVGEVIDSIESELFGVLQRNTKAAARSIADVIPDTLTAIDGYKSQSGSIAIPTGFSRLDEMTMGLRASDLIVLAGRPSMGKTALALNIIQHLALKQGIPCLIFSLEMARDQLVERMICSEARVDSQAMRKGRLNSADYELVGQTAKRLSESPIIIDDSPTLTALELRSRARRLKALHGIRLIVVDYMQLMTEPSRSENRQQEIAAVSRSLKSLAKELNVPVLALSQLSRQVEQRGGDHRPQLSDLRESGAIEQDADVVMFVYRPERYDHKADAESAEIIIAKQRNGPTGTIPMIFKREHTRFGERV